MYITINGFTKQKMIDIVNANFKGKSYDFKNHMCRYKDYESGRKCAVGLFIPDSAYCEVMEGRSAYTLVSNFPILESHMPLNEKGLDSFQGVHDNFNEFQSEEEQKSILIDWIKANVYDTKGGE